MNNLLKLFSVFGLVLGISLAEAQTTPNVSVVFVLDESGSVSSSNFRLETDGFRGALSGLPADDSIEVSVVGFSSFANVLVDKSVLNATTFPVVDTALANNPKNSGGTAMDIAIDTAARLLQNSSASSKVICLATDGRPNNELSTTSAATNAKANGIVLTPVGIGLSASGKSFLDSIASSPPVANPSNFTEFATVVQNVCVGVTQNAAGIQFTPNPLNFGFFTPESLNGVNEQRQITLVNRSTQSLVLTSLQLTGPDAADFKLSRDWATILADTANPVILAPRSSLSILVSLDPNLAPTDSTFDATLLASATDPAGTSVSAQASLTAVVGPVALNTNLIVANANNNITTGVMAGSLTEQQVFEGSVASARLRGFVADGNARLLLVMQTNFRRDLEIRVPSDTGMQLTQINKQPITGNTIAVSASELVEVTPGLFQKTIVLIAPERFRGLSNEPQIEFDLDIRVVNNNGSNAATLPQTILVQRAPVVLIHGLWADNSTWRSEDDPNVGVLPELQRQNFQVTTFGYDGTRGPSETVPRRAEALTWGIEILCKERVSKQRIACTQADIVAHSMGGLFVREYIRRDLHKTSLSQRDFGEGNIRRLITLGTPHLGSPLANILLQQNGNLIGNCITSPNDIDEAIGWLSLAGKDIGSGIVDLAVGSEFLSQLNQSSQVVPSLLYYGNVGRQYDQSLSGILARNLVIANLEEAGCTYDNVFAGQASDGIVALTSAQHNGTVAAGATRELTNIFHTGMGGDPAVATAVANALLEDVSPFSPVAFVPVTNQPSYTILTQKPKYASVSQNIKEHTIGYFNELGRWMLSNWSIATARAAGELITINTPQLSISPGDTITISATVDPSVSMPVALLSFSNNSRFGDTIDVCEREPCRWTITYPTTASGTKKLKAVALLNNGKTESNDLEIVIQPNLTDLRQLSFDPSEEFVLFPGQEVQLMVLGLFNDGFKRDLTSSALGTAYNENIVNGLQVTNGNSPVLSVSTDGLVLAQQPGTAEVVASNGNQTVVRRITVLAIAENDADGDKLTDSEESRIGTNPYHPDSDGDGITDSKEVGADTNNPFDSDQDAHVDALDGKILAFALSNGKSVSVETSAGKIVVPQSRALLDLPSRQAELAAVDMGNDALSFTVEALTPGEEIDVTLTFEELSGVPNRYLVYGMELPETSTTTWYNYENFTATSSQVTLRLRDGALGDNNLQNGVISIVGGPGVVVVESKDDGGLCTAAPGLNRSLNVFFYLGLVASAIFWARRRRFRGSQIQ